MSAWMKFLKAYYAKNKGTKSYKQSMIDAAKIYKKKPKAAAAKKKVPRKKRRKVKREEASI